MKIQKICRYYNRGYCKFKSECRFCHIKENCAEHLKSGGCKLKNCPLRHPKVCKWYNTNAGCKRALECEYLVVTLASDDFMTSFKCEGCKDTWTDLKFVVAHVINNSLCYFCLNCNDWIHYKANVFDKGWTLLDEAGFLRTNI